MDVQNINYKKKTYNSSDSPRNESRSGSNERIKCNQFVKKFACNGALFSKERREWRVRCRRLIQVHTITALQPAAVSRSKFLLNSKHKFGNKLEVGAVCP